MEGKIEPAAAIPRAQEGLRTVALRGGAWTAAQVVVNKSVTLLGTLALLQLLAPQDFATATIASSAQALALVLPPITIGDVLVANAHRFQRFKRVAMWCGATSTAAVAIGLGLAGPYLSESYGDPALRTACLWIGLRPVGDLLALAPTSVLRLQLRFRALAAVESMTAIVATALSVTMAFLGLGFLSILLPPAIASILRAGMYATVVARSTDRIHAEDLSAADTAKTTSLIRQVVFACLAQYVHGTFFFCAPMLLGMFVTAEEVGWYWSAFTLATSLNAVVSFAMGNLLQPIFARMADDRLRQTEAFLTACRTVSTIAMPLCLLQAVLADPLFAILPERWQGALHATEVMCIGQAFFFPVNPAMALMKARAEFGKYFAWQSTQLIVVAGAMVLAGNGSPSGPFMPMVAIASLAHVVFAPMGVGMCSATARSGVRAALSVFARPLLVSIVGIAPIWAMTALRPTGSVWSVAALILLPPSSVLSCALALALVDRPQFHSLARDIRSFTGRLPGGRQ